MLRRFLDFNLSFLEKRKKLARFRPLVSAIDAFCYEPCINVKKPPFIRDAVDLKRWMVLVVIALLPTVLMAIWNTGLQKMVYGSSDAALMRTYLDASSSFKGYFHFALTDARYLTILKLGSLAFFPVLLISYLVGGLVEGIFAVVRGHEIAEGFLVTGILYPLILPPTMPYWMVAVGVALGVVISKELFGGTGMNILNPALTARALLFFTFPGKMTGDLWVGTNPSSIVKSLQHMNAEAGLNEVDGFTQATPLQGLNGAIPQIKQIHVDAIASHTLGSRAAHYSLIDTHFQQWKAAQSIDAQEITSLTADQLHSFITAPAESGGLGLLSGNYVAAHNAAETIYGLGPFSDGNLFWGNILGSMGETSVFACLLGALFLIWTGVGSWRTMAAFGIGAFITASFFQFFSHFGADAGAWNPAKFALPAYRHLMMGGLAFGLVYMATDPVSSPAMRSGRWIYGLFVGFVTILIREINPAYPEGVMLAILLGNVFAPLIDHYAIRRFRKGLGY